MARSTEEEEEETRQTGEMSQFDCGVALFLVMEPTGTACQLRTSRPEC